MRQLVSRIGVSALLITNVALAEPLAVVGATVHTVGQQGTIENATIVIDDGRIVAVGTDVSVPVDVETIDAKGKIVTPGLFAPAGQIGLVEVELSAGPLDAVQRGERFTASFDVADAFNARSTLVPINRIEGVTRALITPQSQAADEEGKQSHVISGQAAIVHLGDGGDNIMRHAAAMVINIGESGSQFAGESRASALLVLRNALDEAIDYRDHKADYERGMRRNYAHSMSDLDALQAVINGDIPLLVHVHRASDIEALIRLVEEYGVRAAILGGAEAWMVAGNIAKAGIAVILDPTENLPASFDRINARLDSAAVLAGAGVQISLADSTAPAHNARNITQAAGNAVADGLPWDAALRAITLAPAEIYGVADQLGSIEAGKLADLVIWPGDPLELTNYPDRVLINGELISMRSRQTLLRDRYLQDSKKPPAFRK